ncbi:MAG: NUDIX hydrolase [Leptospirillia bacterium]
MLDVPRPGDAGKHQPFEIVRFGQGVAILPITADGRVVLIRQLRPAVGVAILEIPAGKMEVGEEILESARRELFEETGIEGADLHLMQSIYTTPGFCDEVIHLVMARGGTVGRPHPEEDEWIDPPLFLEREELRSRVALGEVRDAKTLVALGLAGFL